MHGVDLGQNCQILPASPFYGAKRHQFMSLLTAVDVASHQRTGAMVADSVRKSWEEVW
jgi:hypothetical protein